MPERADPKPLSVGFDCYRTILVGTIDMRPHLFEPFKDIPMRNAKEVVCTAADNSHLGHNFFQKRKCAGARTAVVRNKEHIALKVSGGFDYA